MDKKQHNAKHREAEQNQTGAQPTEVRTDPNNSGRRRAKSVPVDAGNPGPKRARRSNAKKDSGGHAARNKPRSAKKPGRSRRVGRPKAETESRAKKAWAAIQGKASDWKAALWSKIKQSGTIIAALAAIAIGGFLLFFRKSNGTNSTTASTETEKGDKIRAKRIKKNTEAQKKAEKELYRDEEI